MARLRRFLMLERARGEREEPSAPPLATRFEGLSAPAQPDPFAPPPDPALALEADAPSRPEPSRDSVLAAEIAAMAAERARLPAAPPAPIEQRRYRRPIDRAAAAIAVGPLAAWSPRARLVLVAGLGAAAIAALFLVGGIGPRMLQGALVLLLFALFVPS